MRGAAMWASVVALALAASLPGIRNGFAFDDVHIIVDDNRTHSLAHWWWLFAQSYWPLEKGGDLYRPATMLGFAIQWAIGGGAPLVFHIVSIALYALVCAAFLGILLELLPQGAAWAGAALFAVHPLHVEAVGNVVGQSELLAALFMFLALLVFLKVRRQGAPSVRDSCVIVLSYALGCLSKEHAIVLPALLLAAEVTVVAAEAPIRQRLASMRLLILMLTATGLAFVWVRIVVLGSAAAPSDESNALFSGEPFGIRAMTMLRVLLEWVRLFFWPAHLAADYSPRAIDIVTGPSPEMLASAAILAGFTGLVWVSRRSAPAGAFAFMWVVIALLIPSNLLIPTGFVLAERTLFLASGGVALGIAVMVARLMASGAMESRRPRAAALAAMGVALVLGLARSGLRQRVWRDNDTLFAQTVKDSPASYKAHLAYAVMLFQHHRRSDAFMEIKIAHALFPEDPGVLEYAADEYARVEGCGRAVAFYRRVLTQDPGRDRSRIGLAACLIAMGDHAGARKTISQGFLLGDSRLPLEQLRRINDSTEAALRARKRN